MKRSEYEKSKSKWGKSTVLPPNANPEEWQPLRETETDAFRSLDCAFYSTCLDFSAERSWDSFTCIYCSWHAEGGKRDPKEISLQRKDYDPTESSIIGSTTKEKGEMQ